MEYGFQDIRLINKVCAFMVHMCELYRRYIYDSNEYTEDVNV